MKIDPPEPRSIDDEPAPKLLREYVRATRQSGPDETAIDRMSSRLATAGVLPPPASNPTAAPSPGRKLAYRALGAVAIVLSAGLVLTWRATQDELASGTSAPTASSMSVSSADRPPAAQAARPSEPASDRPMDGSRTAAVAVDDLPAASPSGAAAAPATRGSARTTGTSPAENAGQPPPTELELVKRAQSALVSSPERALAITNEHARVYPSGEFVQEREVIEVEALSRLGRKEEARRRAVAFVRRFPETPYTPRLEIAVGRPLVAPSTSVPAAAADDPGRARAIPTP